MEKKLTRASAANAAFLRFGITKQLSKKLLNSIFVEMSKAFQMGKPVKISSFGSFKVIQKRSRVGRNPKTGVAAEIAPRRVVVFHPSALLKDLVSNSKSARMAPSPKPQNVP